MLSAAEMLDQALPSAAKVSTFLKKVKPRHRAMMRLLISGFKQKGVAEHFGISQSRLSLVISSPLFKNEMDAMEESIKKRIIEKGGDIEAKIDSFQLEAADVIKEIMDNGANPVRLRRDCARDILSFGKIGRSNKDSSRSDFAQIIKNAKELAEVKYQQKLAARKAAGGSGIVDITTDGRDPAAAQKELDSEIFDAGTVLPLTVAKVEQVENERDEDDELMLSVSMTSGSEAASGTKDGMSEVEAVEAVEVDAVDASGRSTPTSAPTLEEKKVANSFIISSLIDKLQDSA